MDLELLRRLLAPEIVGELRTDAASRELYARDASLYRRLPVAALRARVPGDLEAAIAACAESGVPLTMRGAGTSLAGQTVGRGLVVDCSALDAIAIDPDRRRARVGPGAVLSRLNGAASQHGLIFGADVATADRATLGGMIANNSAGTRSVVHGLTAHHVRSLTVVLADGARARLARGSAAPAALTKARGLAARAEPAALLRRVSGYDLGALAEDDWPRLLCGSEGTLAITLEAELDLVDLPASRGLALLSYRSVEEAAAAVPALLRSGPSAIELIDEHLLDPRNRAPADVDLLDFADADAGAMLVVEHSGESGEVERALTAIEGARVVREPAAQERIWAARRLGIGRAQSPATARAGGRDPRPVPFIEDPAVPPERLEDFVRAARRMLAEEGVPAIWYGHASVGCMHIRPLMDLTRTEERRRMRRLAEGMADLVADHEGSLSGEHGDGRARGELLGRMYRPETLAAFAELKARVDPHGVLNPGVIVDPEPLDAGLDAAIARPERDSALPFEPEGGIARAATLCSRNGLCRSDAGAMCPSYQALGDERHSTRGRAMIFAAVVEGRLPEGTRDPGLAEALALCLSCKACASECPATVDMGRMKTEILARRPATLAGRLASAAPPLLAAAGRTPRLAGLATRAGALARGRALPRPALSWRPAAVSGSGPPLTLVADTFTRHLHPGVGDAAVAVLAGAGRRVEVVAPGCCGRTAWSAGRVRTARRRLGRMVKALAPRADREIVVLEPSCLSMLTDEIGELLPADPDAARVRGGGHELRGCGGQGRPSRARWRPARPRPLPRPRARRGDERARGMWRGGPRQRRRLLRHGGELRLRASRSLAANLRAGARPGGAGEQVGRRRRGRDLLSASDRRARRGARPPPGRVPGRRDGRRSLASPSWTPSSGTSAGGATASPSTKRG